MSDEKIPDRIKAKLTIELDFAKEDQPLIGEVLQGILDNLGLYRPSEVEPFAQCDCHVAVVTQEIEAVVARIGKIDPKWKTASYSSGSVVNSSG